MKKIIISFLIIVAFAGYVLFYRRTPSTVVMTPTPIPGTPVPSASAQYHDGAYTGPVTDAIFGNMQVQAVISGGRLTDVVFLQYPNAKGHTTEVSQTSLPILKSEAIRTQSAKVDIVSGATQTCEAFQLSLAAALAQAAN